MLVARSLGFYFHPSPGAARAERDKAAARAQVERDAQAYFFHEPVSSSFRSRSTFLDWDAMLFTTQPRTWSFIHSFPRIALLLYCHSRDRFRGDLNLVKGALAQVAERTPLLESAVLSARHMADLVNRPSPSKHTSRKFFPRLLRSLRAHCLPPLETRLAAIVRSLLLFLLLAFVC